MFSESRHRRNLIRFLDRARAGTRRDSVVASDLRPRAPSRFEHFLEKVYANPDYLELLEYQSRAGARHARPVREQPVFRRRADAPPRADRGACPIRDPRQTQYGDLSPDDHRCRAAAPFFAREMLRIQARVSACGTGIFHTLGRTSDLADAVISRRTAARGAGVANHCGRIRRLCAVRPDDGDRARAARACASSIWAPTPT